MSEETVCQGYAKGVFRVCFEMKNSLWDERIGGKVSKNEKSEHKMKITPARRGRFDTMPYIEESMCLQNYMRN